MLIRTCHQIHAEVVRLLYRSPHFTFASASTMAGWQKEIGLAKHFVFHINLSLHWDLFGPKTVPLLKDMTSLKSLNLCKRARHSASVRQVAQDCKPLLEMIVEAKREGEQAYQVANIVQAVPGVVVSETQEMAERANAEKYTAVIRGELRRLLGLEPHYNDDD
jgi:hypothetical protein